MEPHKIKFPRTAHYFTSGTPSPEIKKIFFVFHGYGQLASRFIYKFDQLDEDCLVIAPEGFSRFYWNEAKGIVGASWMTKEDRLTEIEDYCNYIDHLYHLFLKKVPENVQVNLLGFSQGGATAVRWAERNRPHFHNLILWGAAFPEDLDYLSMAAYLSDKKLHVVYGKQDPYLSPERIKKHELFTEQQGLKFNMIWFEGKHEIDRATLKELSRNI